MNFSFKFNSSKQKDQINESAKLLADAAKAYQKSIQESMAQYNEHRKEAEEAINRGGRLTRHQINL